MTTANAQPEQPTVLDVLQASPVGPVLDMPIPRTPMEALAASPLGPWLDTPFTDLAGGTVPPLPEPLPLPPLPPLPGVDHLLQPIADLAGAFGTGTLGSVDPTALLRQSSSIIDTAGLRALDGVWDGEAAGAAHTQGSRTQVAGERLSVRGNEIAAVTQEAAGTVARGNAELVAVAQSFVAVAAAAAPVALTPPGQTMLIAAAADHLQRALTVVAKTRSELAGHQAAMAALGTAIPVPAAPTPAPGLTVGGGGLSPITVAASLLEAVGRPFTDSAAQEVAQTYTAGAGTTGAPDDVPTRPAAALPGATPPAGSTGGAGGGAGGWIGGLGGPAGVGARGAGGSAAQLSAGAPSDAAPRSPSLATHSGSLAGASSGMAPAAMMSPAARAGYDDTVDRTAPGFLIDAAPHNAVVGDLPMVAPAVLGGVDPDDLGFDD